MNTSETPTAVLRPGLSGYLQATCERRSNGDCFLSRKSFKSPIHISKPYWDNNTLLLNLMCPTAGMLENDSVLLEAEVNENASLTLSNPSSLRIHKMVDGGEAFWEQNFKVAPNAFLESNPEWLILQAQSSFTQRTQIDIEKGGELLFIEAIAPGRIAHGEAYAFERFRNRLRLRYDGSLALLEKHNVEPARDSARAWANWSDKPLPFYVSMILVSEKLEPDSKLWNAVYDLQNEHLRIGSSQLAKGPCWSLKLLTDDPVQARKAVNRARELFFETIQRKPAALRRQ